MAIVLLHLLHVYSILFPEIGNRWVNVKMGQRMRTFHIATTVSSDGTLTIKELPFRAGDKVEVTVRRREDEAEWNKRYPLRGKPVRYMEPFEAVAEA